MIKAVCRIAAKRLLNKVFQVRKEHAGALLKNARVVSGLTIKGRDDSGKCVILLPRNHTNMMQPIRLCSEPVSFPLIRMADVWLLMTLAAQEGEAASEMVW